MPVHVSLLYSWNLQLFLNLGQKLHFYCYIFPYASRNLENILSLFQKQFIVLWVYYPSLLLLSLSHDINIKSSLALDNMVCWSKSAYVGYQFPIFLFISNMQWVYFFIH